MAIFRFWALFFHVIWPRGHSGLCFFMVFGGLVQIPWKNKAQNGQAAKHHGKTKPKLENGGFGFVSRGGNSRQTIKTIKIYWFKFQWFLDVFCFFCALIGAMNDAESIGFSMVFSPNPEYHSASIGAIPNFWNAIRESFQTDWYLFLAFVAGASSSAQPNPNPQNHWKPLVFLGFSWAVFNVFFLFFCCKTPTKKTKNHWKTNRF